MDLSAEEEQRVTMQVVVDDFGCDRCAFHTGKCRRSNSYFEHSGNLCKVPLSNDTGRCLLVCVDEELVVVEFFVLPLDWTYEKFAVHSSRKTKP